MLTCKLVAGTIKSKVVGSQSSFNSGNEATQFFGIAANKRGVHHG